jgi:hypothetical protein
VTGCSGPCIGVWRGSSRDLPPLVLAIAIDCWNATQLAGQLEGDELVGFGQGYASMSAPTKRLEQLVIGGQLAHGGNPVLRWMANNVSLETDAADNWKPSKKRSRERIDGIVALIVALGIAGEPPFEPTGEFWFSAAQRAIRRGGRANSQFGVHDSLPT